MPPAHRAFLQQLGAGPSVRQAVQQLTTTAAPGISSSSNGGGDGNGSRAAATTGSSNASLLEAYDAAVSELDKFRGQHRAFARQYIAQWSEKEVGTGGSNFMPALTGYKNTTAAHKLSKQTGIQA